MMHYPMKRQKKNLIQASILWYIFELTLQNFGLSQKCKETNNFNLDKPEYFCPQFILIFSSLEDIAKVTK